MRVEIILCDRSQSVLGSLAAKGCYIGYNSYGFEGGVADQTSRSRYRGLYVERLREAYALGNGHRFYNPVIMRLQTPDLLSPFQAGGINCYAYCKGDPLNRIDPSGRFSIRQSISGFGSRLKRKVLQPYYKVAAKRKVTRADALENIAAYNRVEEILEVEAEVNRGAVIFFVKNKKHLRLITDKESSHKFLLTQRNELIVTVAEDATYVSHGGLAYYSEKKFGTSDKIVSAGWISRSKSGFIVDNTSGHYLPARDRIALAKYHIRGMGASVKNGKDIFT